MSSRAARSSAGLLAALAALALASCSSSTDGPPPSQTSCKFHADCPNDGVCYHGKCEATASCIERKNCNAVPVCEGQRCICSETTNRCLPVCVTDDECSTDGQCVDGVCTPYPISWNGTPPASGARGMLKVGIGHVELDFPMGVSMAGYASRRGPRTPYQDSLGGSNAWHGRPDVRAVAFDDGKEMFVLVRLPMSWSTDEMLTETARKVQEKTGINLMGHIITSATHSHSLPARYWHLVKGLGFGFFGYDEFGFEMFDRYTASFAEAIEMALDDLHPGRFGYTVLDSFDPDGRIHTDRREQNNNLPGYMGKDDRMVLMRIDELDGSPIAVLTNFGMHGTVFDYDNPIIHGDAPAGVEVALTEAASAKYGHPVLGIYVQGNAGDISPRGDFAGHHEPEQVQVVGAVTWGVVEAALDAITTKPDVQVGIVDGRIPITHEALGYGPSEFHDEDVMCENSPPYFRYGAFQCVDGYFKDSDPATKFTDGMLKCVFAVECLTSGFPVPQFQKTHLSVARLGDLAFATMPGEPVSQFGRDLSDRIKDAIPGIVVATTLGYSQDHHFYLLNADDWLQGGYEPSRDIWGWKLGPYLVDRSVELAKDLAKDPSERTFDSGNLKPMVWSDPESEKKYVEPNDTEGAPEEVLLDAPGTVKRLELVTFKWRGGHPGIDRPHVTLEVDRGAGFVTHQKAGGLAYDDSGYEMLVHYDGVCNKTNCSQHAWRVEWQERPDFPTGRYRLVATGHAMMGGQMKTYTARSQTFDVVPNDRLDVYDLHFADSTTIEGRVVYPPVLTFGADGTADDRAGHLLLTTDVPSYIGAPMPAALATLDLRGRIRAPDGTDALFGSSSVPISRVTEARKRIVSRAADGTYGWADAGERPTTKFTISGAVPGSPMTGAYVVTLTLTDPLGNSGTVTATITQ